MEQIETKRKLIDWIKEKTDCFVYTDSKQSKADGVFVVKGTLGAKPDLLLVKISSGFKWCIAVEVKPGSSKGMTDGMFQCIKYAGQYLNEDAKYFIDGKLVEIQHFVVATANSSLGFLYDKEKVLGKESFIQSDFLDFVEKPMTYIFWRILWRLWQEKINEYWEKTTSIDTNAPHVGILISKLDNSSFRVNNTFIPNILSNNRMETLK